MGRPHAPNPSPSRTTSGDVAHLDDIVCLDDVMHLDHVVHPDDVMHSDDVACPPGDVEVIYVEEDANTSDSALWDPHMGMKPLPLDDCASDGKLELEDELPDRGAVELHHPMLKLMVKLARYNSEDLKWLPPEEQRKLAARKIGMISSVQARMLIILTGTKGKGRPIPMGPTSLQNQKECSDATHTFRHEGVKAAAGLGWFCWC